MKLAAYLNLIRWKNLLLIIYVFFLFEFFFFPSFYVETILSTFQFLILLFSVLFITAAGYIINDIYDVKADEINKPTKVIVSKIITFEKAKQYYKITNSIGIILGILVCLSIRKPTYSFIFIGTAFLLYYYSKILKGKPLIGNFMVSILVALSVFILPIFSIDFSINNNVQNTVIHIFILLSFFAFSINLIREIIKDIEDVNGDKILNLNTLPIIIGRKRTQIIASYLCLLPIGLLLFIIYNYSGSYRYTMLYLLFVGLIPLSIVALKLRKAGKKSEFHKLSSLLKIIMFFGITTLLITSFIK
tara:strand:+ start:9790 stop:10698 length:909 start_codon:yes stop_codon:yes gene_type:complete